MATTRELAAMIRYGYRLKKGDISAIDIGPFNNIYKSKDLVAFIHPISKVMVLAFRGTVDKRDIFADVQLAVGVENTKRREDAIKEATMVLHMEPHSSVIWTGHSLGANLAFWAWRRLGKHSDKYVGFNGIVPRNEWLKVNKKQAVMHRTAFDPVSLKTPVKSILGGGDVKIKKEEKVTIDPIKAHSLSHFDKRKDEGVLKEDYKPVSINWDAPADKMAP